MGGKKKLTLKQMEKMQLRKDLEKKKKSDGSSTIEKKTGRIFAPDYRNKKVIDEIKKIKVLTPFTVASRFNLRLSIAKNFLKELERRGIVEYVSGSTRLKIYKIPN